MIKNIIIPRNLYKNNVFIETNNKKKLPNTQQLSVFFYGITILHNNLSSFPHNPTDEIDKRTTFEINIKEIFRKEELDKSKENYYKNFKKWVSDLVKLQIENKDGKNLRLTNVFSEVSLSFNEIFPMIKFTFSQPFIKRLDYFFKGFQKADNIFLFDNKNTEKEKIFYALLTAHQTDQQQFKATKITFELKQILKILYVSDHYKNNYGLFNDKILKNIFKKIRNTDRFKDLKINTYKSKRKVAGFNFEIKPFKHVIDEVNKFNKKTTPPEEQITTTTKKFRQLFDPEDE